MTPPIKLKVCKNVLSVSEPNPSHPGRIRHAYKKCLYETLNLQETNCPMCKALLVWSERKEKDPRKR